MPTRPRAALYLRLSQSDDASTSIARQERDLREYADREGWDVVAVLTDDGISGRKARANAGEALRMIRDGEVDVLAVWKFDRWSRQGLAAVADLIGALDTRPEARFVALRDGLRSEQPAWRIIASVLAEVARMEADNTATRVRSSIAALRRDGRFPGGVVPFGYRPAPAPDGPGRILVVDPGEAAIVREVADRLLTGLESLVAISLDLNARGVPATRSAARSARLAGRPVEGLATGTWRTSQLTDTWSSEHLLGRVTHKGAIVRGEDGMPVQVWEPILDLDTALRLRARLTPATLRPRRVRAARLLSGLAYCGHCGGKLYVKHAGGGDIYYGCSASAQGVDCPMPRIKADSLDEYVVAQTLATDGAKPHRHEVTAARASDAAASLVEVEAAIQEATGALASDDADVPALVTLLASLKARRGELRDVPDVIETTVVPSGMTIAEAYAAAETADQQRAWLVDAGVDHVTVAVRERRGRTFDPTRVRIYDHANVDEDAAHLV